MKKELSDNALDRLLALAIPEEMPAGFTDRLMHRAWMLPQRKGLLARLGEGVYSMHWRWQLAGAFAAFLLAFSAGYYIAHTPEDENGGGLYAIDQTDVEAL